MMSNSELVWHLARQHRDDLLDQAERQRLLSAARRYRRQASRRRTG